MDKSNLLNLIKAKSDGNEMLLKDHLKSVIERAVNLRNILDNKITFKDEFWRYLILASFFHDLGKITYSFQYKVNNGELDLELYNFLKNTRSVSVRHEIISALWASLFLKTNDLGAQFVRSAVLLHHYNSFYNSEIDLGEIINSFQTDIETYLDFLISKWDDVKKIIDNLINYIIDELEDEFVNDALNRIIISKDRVTTLKNIIKQKEDPLEFAEFYEFNSKYDIEFFIFLGMLRRADYSASGNVEVEIMNGKIYNIIKNNIEIKIGKDIWQNNILNKYSAHSDMVLVAPTGSGKTEFSLLWNNHLRRKLIYTLPLRVALNDLYDRFKEYSRVPNTHNDTKESHIGLLHSTAFLEFLKETNLNIDEKITTSSLLAEPIILSTPDQVFLISLKYYGFDKILSVAPYSSFVIDEIQAYSPEMAAVTIKSLEMLKKAGANILITTATLPPYFKEFLNDKIGLDENKTIDISKEDISNVKNQSVKRHKIKLEPIHINNKDKEKENEEYNNELKEKITNKAKELVKKGKKILIIVNNVRKAIEIYEKLKENSSEIDKEWANTTTQQTLNIFAYKQHSTKNNNYEVYLLHSRLVEKQKEKVILEVKNKLDNEEPLILISTQVVEASVDFDFDVLLTELSPIDSQIQRWGRVWRNREYKETGEPKDYNEVDPNVYVFFGRKDDDLYVDKGTSAIYSPTHYLKRTFEVLNTWVSESNVLDYKDEKKLIDEVFDDNLKGLFKKKIDDIYEFLDYWNASKKSEAQRVFRKLAGVQVVFPEILININKVIEKNKIINKKIIKNEDIDKIKMLGEIIRDTLLKNKEEPTYEELSNLLGLYDDPNAKYKIRKYLVEYSINVPIYYFSSKNSKNYLPFKRQFKGFYIASLKDNIDIGKLIEEGLDAVVKEEDRVLKKDIDEIIEDVLNTTNPIF